MFTPAETHPGTVLWEEFLKPAGILPGSFAQHIGEEPDRITRIVKGEELLDPELALKFETALGRPADYWMILSGRRALWEARQIVASGKIDHIQFGGD